MTGALTATRRPSAPAAVVGWLSLLGAVGAALLAVGHLGVDVPVVSRFGPGGDRAVPVAAAVFALVTVVYALVAAGSFRRAGWAWPVATVFHGLAVVAGIGQYRGVASAVGIALSLAALGVLLSPAGRRALRAQRR